jgi:hypothetical protein
MTNPPERTPEYWRNKAAEARSRAERMRNSDARAMMLDIADKYETMAERTATREKLRFPKSD